MFVKTKTYAFFSPSRQACGNERMSVNLSLPTRSPILADSWAMVVEAAIRTRTSDRLKLLACMAILRQKANELTFPILLCCSIAGDTKEKAALQNLPQRRSWFKRFGYLLNIFLSSFSTCSFLAVDVDVPHHAFGIDQDDLRHAVDDVRVIRRQPLGLGQDPERMVDLVVLGEGLEQRLIGFAVGLLRGDDLSFALVPGELLANLMLIESDANDIKAALLVSRVPFLELRQNFGTGVERMSKKEQDVLALEIRELAGVPINSKIGFQIRCCFADHRRAAPRSASGQRRWS